MSEPIYTNQSFRPGERPDSLRNFDAQRDVKIIPKENGGNTVMFASDPQYDKAHEIDPLPPEMRGDFSNTPRGLLSRTARLYENAINAHAVSMVTPAWYKTVGAGAGACLVSIVATAAFKMVSKNLGMSEELQEIAEHAVLFGTMTTAMHVAHELMAPKNLHTISEDAARVQEQARNQAREAYILADALEKKQNQFSNYGGNDNLAPLNNVALPEQVEKMIQPQTKHLVGVK
jgi:hypothetical protein